MRSALFIFLSIAMPLQVSAQLACGQAELLAAAARASDVVFFQPPTEADHLLFLDLPMAVSEGDLLVFDYLVGSQPVLSESITILETTEHNVVELLSRHPEHARYLNRAATSEEVEVRLRKGTSIVETLELSEVRHRSAAVRASASVPHALHTELTVLVPVNRPPEARLRRAPLFGGDLRRVSAADCRDVCEDERRLCEEQRCDFSHCAGCDALYDDCIEFDCNICEPTSQTETTFALVSSTPDFNILECFYRPPFNTEKRRVVRAHQVLKKTVTLTEQHADCTVTQTVTVTYPTDDCWDWTLETCSFAEFPSDLCAF